MTLYESSGILGSDVPLEDNPANYTKLEIHYSSNKNRFAQTDIEPMIGRPIVLGLAVPQTGAGQILLREALYTIAADRLSFNGFTGLSISPQAVSSESSNFINIHRVIGYK